MSRAFLKVVLKQKLSSVFIFTLLCGASKRFMKALKAFIKPFEATQRSVKIKIELNFFSSSGIGTGRVNYLLITSISTYIRKVRTQKYSHERNGNIVKLVIFYKNLKKFCLKYLPTNYPHIKLQNTFANIQQFLEQEMTFIKCN